MRRGRVWTEEEKAQVIEMRAKGHTARQIADALVGRSRDAVCGIVERMLDEGRDVPPSCVVRPRKTVSEKQVRPESIRQPKRSDLPMWERDASDRRLAIWERARQAAREALQGSR